MRCAILSAPRCPIVTGAWENGADPRGLPMLLEDRVANGEAFEGERVVRLPRRFSRMHAYERAIALGRGPVCWAGEGGLSCEP